MPRVPGAGCDQVAPNGTISGSPPQERANRRLAPRGNIGGPQLREYSDRIQRGREPGSVQEGPGLWYVPDGTPVEIASFLTGWMIGRAGAPPQAFPAAELPGPTPGHPEPHGAGSVPRSSEWFSPPAFFEGQHRARLDPDELNG